MELDLERARIQIASLESDVKILLASVRSIEYVIEELNSDIRRLDGRVDELRCIVVGP